MPRLPGLGGRQRFAPPARRLGVTGVPNAVTVGDALATDSTRRRLVEDVVERHGQRLFGFVRRLGLTDAEADEVVQEALLRLFTALGGRVRIERPGAWTYRTAYRLAMDRHRLRRRWERVRARLAPADPPLDHRDEALAVWAEVDRLPERQRQVLYLRYRADLAFETIAEVLGIASGSARSAATRAIATLRDRLGEEAD